MSARALISKADLDRALAAAKAAGFGTVRTRVTSAGVEYIFSDGPALPRGGAGDEVELD